MCLQKEISSLANFGRYDSIVEDKLIVKVRSGRCACCSRKGLRLRKNGTVYKHSPRRTMPQTCAGSGQVPSSIYINCPYCSRNAYALSIGGGAFVIERHSKTVFADIKVGYQNVICEGTALHGTYDPVKKLLIV